MNQILGGAGGGGGQPTIVKDNLRSQDSVEFILGVCEGPIAGLVNGPKSFYLNDTPLQSPVGDNNFEAFELHSYAGESNATRIIPKMGGTASNVQVGVELAQFVPVTRTTPASLQGQIDRLEVRIVFNQLVRTTSGGDQLDATAQYRLLYKRTAEANWRSFMGADAGDVTYSATGTQTTTTAFGPPKVTTFTENNVSGQGSIFTVPQGDITLSNQTLAGSVAHSGAPTGFNRKKVGTYGTMYFNTSDGAYRFVPGAALTTIESSITEDFQFSYTMVWPRERGSATTVTTVKTIRIAATPSGLLSLTGKTGSSYVKEYSRRIPPADQGYTGDWEIRLEKLTVENDPNLFVSMTWESFQCITTDQAMKYDNLAVLRGLGASSNQFTSIPTFSGIYAGKLVRMPTNYEPITRVYTGVWNGTFKFGYTDNPAWCLYDLLVDTNYGFKKHYPDLQVDKWSFYEAAQWCDVLVPRSGATGYQPRYTYHDLIDQPRAGLEAAQYIASIFGGIITTDLNGTVRLKLDKPGTPVQIFGPESVTVEGFQYQFADMTSRANDMLVTFMNPELNWNQDVRQVSIQSYIDANGRIPMDFVAVGCIDPYEAQRRAQIRMLAANTEITTVTFTAARAGILMEPYDIIGIVDPQMNWGLSGRIKSILNGVITLRDPLFLTAGVTYTMTVQSKTGPVDVIVQNTGGAVSTQLTRISGSLLSNIPENAQFALTSATVGLVKPFRVISIQEADGSTDLFTISAVEINMNKYGDADNMTASPQQRYAYEQSFVPSTPQLVICESGTDQLYITSAGLVQSRIKVTWAQDPLSFVEEYEVYYRRIDRDAYSKITVNGTDAYIPNAQEGIVYQIYVRAVNILGRRSAPTPVISHTVLGKNEPPTTPLNLVVSQMGSDVRLDWDDVTDLDLSFYEIRLGGTSWETATRLGTSTSSVYTHANVASGTLTYRIKSVDTSGNYSTSALTTTYNVPLPGQPTMTATVAGTDYVLRITPPTGVVVPITGYIITMDGVEIFRGATVTFSGRVNWIGSKTFAVSAINSAGVVSSAYAVALNITVPTQPVVNAQINGLNYVLTIAPPASVLPITEYVITLDGAEVFRGATTTFTSSINFSGSRTWLVRAINSAGGASTNASVSLNVPVPAQPVVTAQFSGPNFVISITPPASTLPVREYVITEQGVEIFRGAATNYTARVTWNGLRTFTVAAVNTAGATSTAATVTLTAAASSAPGLTAQVVGTDYALTITAPTTSVLPVVEYVVTLNTVEIYRGPSLNFNARATWSGLRTFSITAINSAGLVSAATTANLTITAPAAPTTTGTFTDSGYVLSWNVPASTLPIERYVVRNKTNGLVLDDDLKATTFVTPIDWSGSREFEIWAIDSAGTAGAVTTVTATVVNPSVLNLQSRLFKSQLELSWSGQRGSLPIRQYSVYQAGVLVATLDAQNWSVPVDWNGAKIFGVVAQDINGNLSAVTNVTETVDPPQAPSVTATIVDRSIRLTWADPVSELRVREYEVYRDGALVQKVSATTALVPINFAGAKTYRVRAIDEAGNIGAFGDVTITINAPGTFTFDGVIVGDEIRLSWTTPTGSLPISDYQILRGASNTLVTRVSANSYSFKANWVGTETLKIVAYDIAGNTSPEQTKAINIVAPSAPAIKPEVLDNNIMLRWTPGTGTLPIISTEIRRGATFATASVLQAADATFATFFEFQSGTYTYWLVNIDSAGNYGTPVAATVNVSQPPDFVLQTDFDSAFGGTKTLVVQADGKLYFGVDPTQTFQQHFTADGFASPQAQISAGYPFYLQPNNTGTASYQEIFDYGTLLPSSLVTITPTVENIAGDPTILVDIDVKANVGDAWTNIGTAVNQAFATSFRYVRFTLRLIKNSRDDLLAVSRINVRLNSKIKNDAGNGTANATDATGTQVNFAAGFIDVLSISVTPLSTTARFAVYDFVDVPNPTGFKVYMFDTAGNRVSGNFSWQARGY